MQGLQRQCMRGQSTPAQELRKIEQRENHSPEVGQPENHSPGSPGSPEIEREPGSPESPGLESHHHP
jgi:hypothetical protein